MGKSRIIINSVAGKDIKLRRGVRQGDPLSPYLFNLAIDLLPRWIEKLNDLRFLAPPFPQCRTCLLYADDTLLLLRPTRDQIFRTKLIFNLFGQISGLKVNLLKSEIALTSSSPLLLQALAAVMQCTPQKFPIKYLGLPLSDKALTADAYLPIIEKTQASLAGWKASLLSIGGRLVLTNSVISAIPIYFMSVFRLPKWVLKRIDKIRKKFLWHGHKNLQSQGKGLYMVNWALATRPRQLGGLGVRDIQITNHALLMKWMWQWYDQRNAWWTLITPLFSLNDKPWQASNGSSFWKSLANVAPAFHSSTLFKIGNGLSTSFWHDNWHGKPLNLLFPNLYQLVQDKTVSVAHCLQDRSWSLLTSPLGTVAQNERDELLHSLLQVRLTPQQDEVTWLRSSNGFSVRSAYNFLSQTPSPISNIQHIWKLKAPLRISIFAWLLLNNRLTTLDNLARRGWCLPNICTLCKREAESIQHLFQQCTITKEVRDYIYTTFCQRFFISPKYNTVTSVELLLDPAENKATRQWEISTCFVLWRERCRRIFSDKELPLISIVREVYLEQKAWFHDHME